MKQSDIKRDEQLSALLDSALDAQQPYGADRCGNQKSDDGRLAEQHEFHDVPDDFVVADADSVSIHSEIRNAQYTEKSVIGLN